MDNQNLLEEIRNSNLDKVPSKFEEKFKKTFLENRTGFHEPTKQEVIAHQHSPYRDQRYPHQIGFESILEKNSSGSRLIPSITGRTSCKNGTRFIDDVFLVKLVWYITSNIITLQAQQAIPALIEWKVQTSKHGETRRVTQPIKQCRRQRVSEQKLRVHDKYGETRYQHFFKTYFEDMMRVGCW